MITIWFREGKADTHLKKCREMYVDLVDAMGFEPPEYVCCRYNPGHKCWQTEISFHEMQCSDRKQYISPYVLEKLSRKWI